MEKQMEEIWRPVRGKEEYAEISNFGQIHRFERVYYSGRGYKTKRIQKESWTYGSETSDGYLKATIGNVSKGVHIWVYLTFNDCDIPKGLEVNHIDENKHNNHLDNLNLLSHGDNVRWGTGIERMAVSRRGKYNTKKSKPVQALDKNGNIVYEFPSTKEAGRQGFDQGHVAACCRGEEKSHKGLIWRFAVQ